MESDLCVPGAAGGAANGRRQVRLGKIWIDALRLEEALQAVRALVGAGAGGGVFTPNVDHLVTVEDDAGLRDAYAAASLSLADGQPLVWASRLLGTPLPERVAGSDLIWPLMAMAARERWRVYLLGGGPGVGEQAAARLRQELDVNVVGVDAPRISLDDADPEAAAAAARVREARPDLVVVALGNPKQERWIHGALPAIRPAVALGLGASLDFVAGRVRRAPRWMARAGLEWLFRLWLEPRRLAYRYLVKDPRFLLILARTAMAPRRERMRWG